VRRLALALCLWSGMAGPGWAAEVPLDVVFRADGSTVAGRVTVVQLLFLKLNVKLVEDQPKATLSIPLVDVDHIDFGERQIIEAYLERVNPDELIHLERFWRQRESLLKLPESTAGAFGLALADLLLDSKSVSHQLRAMQLFQRIEKEDWSADRRVLAREGRLRALVRLGRAEEAVEEARAIAEEAEDPRVLIEAKYVLAEAGMVRLRELEDKNPRWDEDDEVRPERNRLYNEVLDLFLFPYLFYGSYEHQAARGLWGAVEVYRFSKELDSAVERARDLVYLYPQGSDAAAAKALISELSQPAARLPAAGGDGESPR
jgi:hypothetical protein